MVSHQIAAAFDLIIVIVSVLYADSTAIASEERVQRLSFGRVRAVVERDEAFDQRDRRERGLSFSAARRTPI